MADVVEKKCSACSETKPATDFHKDRGSADGLNAWCKACRAAQYQELHFPVGKEIDAFGQLESVIRTMAELQAAIEVEQARCEAEVQKIRDASVDATGPWQANLKNWGRMLRQFFVKQGSKTASVRRYDFRFGSVELIGQRMGAVSLKSKLAAARMGKP